MSSANEIMHEISPVKVRQSFMGNPIVKKAMLVFVLAVIAAGGVSLLSWLYYAPPVPQTHIFNKGENAAWLRHQWFSEEKSDEEIDALLKKLKKMQVSNVFILVGPLDAKGRVPKVNYQAWNNNLRRIRNGMPSLMVLAWMGGINQAAYGKADDTLDLKNDRVTYAITEEANKMVNMLGFMGIHYDIEPLPDGDENFIKLLWLTRMQIRGVPISVAAPMISPTAKAAKIAAKNNLALWSKSYLRQIGTNCGQIAIMSYDSLSPTPATYRKFMIKQVEMAGKALDGTNCRLLMGVPSYEEKSKSHNPQAENMQSGLEGVITGLEKAKFKSNFQGVAIYSLWTTDEREMDIYEKIWLGKK